RRSMMISNGPLNKPVSRNRLLRRLALAGVSTALLLANWQRPSILLPLGGSVAMADTPPLTTELPIPTASSGTFQLTFGPDNNFWFCESVRDKIGRVTPTGTFNEFPLPSGSTPYAITGGPDNNLWFTEQGSNSIGKITPTGTITHFPIPTLLSRPFGITSGPDGNLWFTEANTSKIGRVTPSGSFMEFPLPTSGAA